MTNPRKNEMNTQPEALRLADALQRAAKQLDPEDHVAQIADWFLEDAAAELRRLHALNADLLEALNRLADWAEQIRASGDAGFWDWIEGDEYMQARAVIAKAGEAPL